eukprot:SAG31_NODE_324_length_17691_cov_8.128126_13_plen_329_part_00
MLSGSMKRPMQDSAGVGMTAAEVSTNRPAAFAHFRTHGMLRIDNLVARERCTLLSKHVDDMLMKSTRTMAAAERSNYFGAVYCEEKRWDMFLRLAPEVLALLHETLSTVLKPLLASIVTAHGRLCELSALISDPGASRQPLHADTKWMPNVVSIGDVGTRVVTCFIALQDIDAEMGPTVMIPGTHTDAEAHRKLATTLGQASREAELGELRGATASVAGLELPVVHCTLRAGDAVLMDSQLFHCGGANRSLLRRRLLYFSAHAPGHLPAGSTYSIFPFYKDKLTLSNPTDWSEEPAAELVDELVGSYTAAVCAAGTGTPEDDENEWPV